MSIYITLQDVLFPIRLFSNRPIRPAMRVYSFIVCYTFDILDNTAIIISLVLFFFFINLEYMWRMLRCFYYFYNYGYSSIFFSILFFFSFFFFHLLFILYIYKCNPYIFCCCTWTCTLACQMTDINLLLIGLM